MRMEHPNPQFKRDEWINLNGEWNFEYDNSKSGKERELFNSDSFSMKINVPFCMESELSGIGNKDFMNCVWYLKEFELPKSWTDSGRVFINFGAVDYFTTVYVNKKEVGTHFGGYTSFRFDITDYITEGKNIVTLCVEDEVRTKKQPSGKQSAKYNSYGCFYTRTTGIWQTVHLEHTPQNYIENFKFYPDVENQKLTFCVTTKGCGKVSVKTSYEGKDTGSIDNIYANSNTVWGEISLSKKYLWEIGNGRLYDVEINFGEDKVNTYFGLRNVKFEGMKFMLNGKSVFQRLVLDQGFYPDGIYTAPSEEALVNDIKLSLAAGFNGARLHEKVFEPLFLYHCDKLGYIVWEEHPNWGMDHDDPTRLSVYLSEWKEAVERDFNHPAIIGWCPFNETVTHRGMQHDGLISAVYQATKSWDNTRPCIDTSGWMHVETDIYDVHSYCQNPAEFKEKFENFIVDGEGSCYVEKRHQHYSEKRFIGKPFFVSEYGGIKWAEGENAGWGYGDAPKTKEELIERYKGLTDVLLDDENMFAFCYTQLYDVEQEINGLYTYDRRPKFDMEIFKKINSRKAKIEE